MKKIIILALALISGCAAQKSPEQIAEAKEAEAVFKAKVSAVKIKKEAPDDCKYIDSLTSEDMGIPIPQYKLAMDRMLRGAVRHGANTVVIDSTQNPSPGFNKFVIYARVYDCPE